ncbi:hypothetical protein N8D56_21375 [Devosia sp. A8/3-2]|nr:hypothetical protein N8D56_21375 [Devosia sp. A8/3-2]
MARHASTYRQARRAEYRSLVANGFDATWQDYNGPKRVANANVKVGLRTAQLIDMADRNPARSKYMPHIGAKQRAKGLARSA